jgi:uncharacterized repeat protein (TIGR01451 family)
MKTLVVITTLIVSFAFGQGTQLELYDYQLQANSLVKMKNGRIGFISMKQAKSTKEESNFGFWLSNNTNANAVFLDVKDGQKSIATVTAKDFAAKAKSQTAGKKTSTVYTAGSGANAVTITIETEAVADTTMPLGKVVLADVKVKAAGTRKLSAVMTLYGDGFVSKIGTNGLTNSNVENGKAAYPLVMLVGNAGTTASTESAPQKTAGKLVKLTSATVSSTGEEVSLLSFRTHATTVKNFEKSISQAMNVESVVSTKKEKTELSLLNSASKATPFPGDTITYTITYHNIGNAAAQDITISNPIPVNTSYVEKSAAGDGAEITEERKKLPPPQIGEVLSVSWKIKKQVRPGEEGTVSLKAVIR